MARPGAIRIFVMSMPTHRFQNFVPLSGEQDAPTKTLAGPRRAAIKRVCLRFALVLLAGGMLAALIALKTTIFFWRFQYS
jgi:hypothetical protein